MNTPSLSVSKTLGALLLPPGFPSVEFDQVNSWMAQRTHGEPRPSVWFAFASAWNAVAYRLKAAESHGQAFTISVERSSGPPSEERYVQDHDLFAFTASAVSALECFHFAAYSVGHVLEPVSFPLASAKDLVFYAQRVAKRFSEAFGATDPLVVAMNGVLTSHEFSRVKALCDVLAHRGTPPRKHYLSTHGPDQPSTIPSNLKDLAADWDYTAALASVGPLNVWLHKCVPDLIVALDRFCASRR